MLDQMSYFLRLLSGVFLGTGLALVILHLGDLNSALGFPSLIEQPPSTWIYIFPWIFGAGAMIGFMAGLATIGTTTDPNRLALTIIACAMVVTAAIESYFAQGSLLPIMGYLIGTVLRTFFLVSFSFIGVFIAMIFGLGISRSISGRRRSALEIAPDELKAQWQNQHLVKPPASFFARIVHLFRH